MFVLTGNGRLLLRIAVQSRAAKRKSKRTGQPAGVFADFEYRTLKSWGRKRRAIGKAECARSSVKRQSEARLAMGGKAG